MSATHGRIGTYMAGCRCVECRAASANHRRKYRMAERGAGIQERTSMCPFCLAWFTSSAALQHDSSCGAEFNARPTDSHLPSVQVPQEIRMAMRRHDLDTAGLEWNASKGGRAWSRV